MTPQSLPPTPWLVILSPLLLFQMLATAICIVLSLGNLDFGEDARRSWLRLAFHTLWMSVLLVGLQLALLWLTTNARLRLEGINFSIATLIGLAVYALFASRYTWPARLILGMVTFSTIVTLMEWSGPYGVSWLTGGTVGGSTPIAVLSDLLLVLFGWVVHHYSIQRYRLKSNAIFIVVMEALIVIVMAEIHQKRAFQWNEARTDIKMFLFVMFLALYMINLMTYLLIWRSARDQKELLQMKISDQRQQMELQMARLSEDNLHELREIRHDLKNHVSYMQALLEAGDHKALAEYFEQLTGKFSEQLFVHYDFGNKTVTAVMNLEQRRAQEKGIRLNLNIAVPETLPVDESDLCALLTNAIDNAIEACEREGGDRISLVMNCPGGDSLYCCVMNPTCLSEVPRKLGMLGTSKADKALHGHGINIMRGICRKYDGHFNCRIEDGQFMAEMLLNLGKENPA